MENKKQVIIEWIKDHGMRPAYSIEGPIKWQFVNLIATLLYGNDYYEWRLGG